jgi:hypothetical protein
MKRNKRVREQGINDKGKNNRKEQDHFMTESDGNGLIKKSSNRKEQNLKQK